jgi:hypothetical protein
MRKPLFFFLFFCISSNAGAQIVYPYGDIKLEKPADYIATEPMALSAATFLLTTPFTENDEKRVGALRFLSNWMVGAKTYSFYMQGTVQELREDMNLLQIFIAAMTKYSMENKAAAANPLTVEMNAAKMVIAYCDDAKNNLKLKKKYRKILEKK